MSKAINIAPTAKSRSSFVAEKHLPDGSRMLFEAFGMFGESDDDLISYQGTAPAGSKENDPVWTLKTCVFVFDGQFNQVVEKLAPNGPHAWTERATVHYCAGH